MIRGPAACPAPQARQATRGNCGLSGKIKKKHLHQELCESVTEGDNTKMGALEPAGESLGSFQGRGVCSQEGENRAGLLYFLTAIP